MRSNNNLLKLMLVAIVLSVGFHAIAMEVTKPDTIILVSAEGKEFVLPLSAAKRSGQIADLLQMANQEHIEFKEIQTVTLEQLVPLLIALDKLLQQNEQAD